MNCVYENASQCCGCAACSFACPRHAIHMEERGGFKHRFPKIDPVLCVDCGRCREVCPMRRPAERRKPIQAFAAQALDSTRLMKASSGGVFSLLAKQVLAEGGAVCGSVMERREDGFEVKHILIRSLDGLEALQGSKYVQSNMDELYGEIRKALQKNQKVLLTGTPCQVSAVRNVFHAFGDLLLTCDIICHGVPSNHVFNDYVKFEEQQLSGCIQEFYFRDKQDAGWGHSGRYIVKKENREYAVPITKENSSYYYFFHHGFFQRESCYVCPFANLERVGDLTLGDYWGVQRFNPELLTENGGPLESRKGISCVLVNTEAGEKLIEQWNSELRKYPISSADAAVVNTQLRSPVPQSPGRDEVLALYAHRGYPSVDRFFRKKIAGQKLKKKMIQFIPSAVKQRIKKALHL